MQYAKPHLDYNAQVALLQSRGLIIDDRASAVRDLKRIGYYRLSAYTYPLREPGEASSDGRTCRADTFVPGARFDDAVRLCDFDARLRGVLLEGLHQLELGMRVRIGYQLGKTSAFGHVDATCLDAARCREPVHRDASGATPPLTLHEAWLKRYMVAKDEAHDEDFVKHFSRKYEARLPVWVATEVMSFGCLVRLFYLLAPKDGNRIASEVLAGNRDVLYPWLRALNVLRNHCAHNNRVWNRSTVYPPFPPPANLVPERLSHLREADPHKVYFLAALCAHLAVSLHPGSRWPTRFAEAMRKFPVVNGMTPENTMGFPESWREQALWRPAV